MVADRYAAEAITISAARQLHPSHAAALTVRAQIYARRAACGALHHLELGRDAADVARRIAILHRLPWQELAAMDAHVQLDLPERVDDGWTGQAADLRARLIPTDLEPDPLTSAERVAAPD